MPALPSNYVAPHRRASQRAIDFARDLMRAVDATAEQMARFEQQAHEISSADMSQRIDALKQLRNRRNYERGTDNLRRVVDELNRLNDAGRLNEFGASLHEQWGKYGRLSDRQIEAFVRGLERRRPDRPASPVETPEEAFPALPEVPTGRYAVDAANGELTFYRVARDRSGRTWVHLQHGPAETEVPFTRAGYTTILQSIVDAGIYEAAVRYGREIGRCSRCHLRLTNRLSRELGIGPICGDHFHTDHSEWLSIRGAARDAIRARGEDPDENV